MIEHKEAKTQIIKLLKLVNKTPESEYIERKMFQYINQQKKTTKLLGLYKEYRKLIKEKEKSKDVNISKKIIINEYKIDELESVNND